MASEPRRREYEMSDAQLERIKQACRPVPYIVVGGYPPRSPQENANAAWESLGREMGFEGHTARPVPRKGPRFFTAVPVAAEREEEQP